MEKTELTNAQKQNRVRQRISQASVDPNKYEYIPAKEQNDHVKADQYQQVAIYARVSTDNPMQTTSFELQQKYYEELVAQHPQWVLVKIYADEGKRIRGVVGDFGQGVGNGYYVEKSMTELRNLTRQEWQTRLAGQMVSTGTELQVTSYDELRSFIQEELGGAV